MRWGESDKVIIRPALCRHPKSGPPSASALTNQPTAMLSWPSIGRDYFLAPSRLADRMCALPTLPEALFAALLERATLKESAMASLKV